MAKRVSVVELLAPDVAVTRDPAPTTTEPRHPRLSVDGILDEALQLVGDEGQEALTMRRLARRLGVEAMSLYHHFPNKAALMARMADRSAAVVLADRSEAASWDEQLRDLLFRTYEAGMINPVSMQVLAAHLSEERRPDLDDPARTPTTDLIERAEWLVDQSPLAAVLRTAAVSAALAAVIGAVAVRSDPAASRFHFAVVVDGLRRHGDPDR